MTAFEKHKRRIKAARFVSILCGIYLIVNSLITLTMDVALYSSRVERRFALIVYISMFICMFIIKEHKCIRCKNRIAVKQLLNMDSFVCPYCGTTDFID